MRQNLKELMAPINAKDPDKVAKEKERRKVLLREELGITDATPDTEYLKILIEEVFMQTDQRGGPKGPRLKPSINNLKLLVKTSFCRNSGRAKNLQEAALKSGMTISNFKKQQGIHKHKWQDIQNIMSRLGEEDIDYRKTCQGNLSKVTVSRENLVADRKELIRQRDKLTTQETDQIDLKDEEIFLHDYLISELDESYRYFLGESKIGFEVQLEALVDKIFVPPRK